MRQNIYEEKIYYYEQTLRTRKLFRAVILKAIKDAYSNKFKLNKKLKAEARSFLRGGADLKVICGLAEVSQEEIEAIAKNKKLENKEKYYKIKLILRKNIIF